MNIYQVCVLSALLYGSETRTRLHETGTPLELSSICDAQAYPRRQVALQHHQHWDTVTSIPIMHSLLSQKHLRWLGIRRMDVMDTSPRNNDGHTGVKKVGRPTLWFMDACKCDLKVCEINPNNWEDAASYRNRWRRTVKERIEKPKQTWNVTRKLKRSTLVAKKALLFPTPEIHLRRVQEALALAHWPAQLHKHHHWLTRAHNVCPSRPRLPR